MSGSTVVRMPRASMPRRRQTPETPTPEPISTAVRTPALAASTVRSAPVPAETGSTPSSWPRSLALASTASSMGRASA